MALDGGRRPNLTVPCLIETNRSGHAVRQAPTIPRAYSDWGDLLAEQGNAAGAIAKYSEASLRGPRFADPLKGWGDVLIKQGRGEEAAVKYDAALEYAPNWKQLMKAREALTKRKS